MLPSRFDPPPGTSVSLSLHVGEQFIGERSGFHRAFVANLRRYGPAGATDLVGLVPTSTVGDLAIPIPGAASYLVALDTNPSEVVLSADKFHAYLHEEGLDFIIRARDTAGTATMPGRERYRRHVKTVVQSGRAAGSLHTMLTGQKLEIVPLSAPSLQRPGQDMRFQVLFEGKPLARALLKLWHKRGTQTLQIRSLTAADGRSTVSLPWPGTWMASVVHMVPAESVPNIDWESHWGNITFRIPPR